MSAASSTGRDSFDHSEPPGWGPSEEPDDRPARLARLMAEIAELERRAVSRPASVSGDPERAPGPVGPQDSSAGRRDQAAEARAKNICLRLLTGSPRSRADLASALARREIDPEVAERVLDRLQEVGLIDDAAYAAAFVRTKARDRGLARSALAGELRRHGVQAEVAGAALAEVGDDAELGRAQLLLDKRIDAAMEAGYEAARRRLVGLLARRGYTPAVAVRAVDDAIARYLAQSG